MSGPDERTALGAAIVRVCRRLYDRGLIAGPDGNVSVRLEDDSILVTPTGMAKVDVESSDLVVLRADGTVLNGHRRPSSEIRMHLRIYELRPEIRAVVHAHPPTATGFAVAGESFVAPVLPEVMLQMGMVPLVEYATPGSDALADAVALCVRSGHNGFLLANHGATTLGQSLEIAHQRMESLEHGARIVAVARGLGRVRELSDADVRALYPGREEEE